MPRGKQAAYGVAFPGPRDNADSCAQALLHPRPLSRPHGCAATAARTGRAGWSPRHKLSVDDLIWPVFVQEGSTARTPVASMPGVDRLTDRPLRRGRQGSARSRHSGDRDLPGDRSQRQDARRARGLQPGQPRLPRHPGREEGRVTDIGVVCDVALDPFNSDGHDGIVRDGVILNDEIGRGADQAGDRAGRGRRRHRRRRPT